MLQNKENSYSVNEDNKQRSIAIFASGEEAEFKEISYADLSKYGKAVIGANFLTWLLTHNPILQSRPVELMVSNEGMKKVWDELARMEHPVFGKTLVSR